MDIYYIDTCIWRDYYENREDKFRPLGEWALELFKKIKEKKGKIIYSDFVEQELLAHYDKSIIANIFSSFSEEKIIEKVEANRHQIAESKKISKEKNLAFGDVLHAVLARDKKAIVVSRDHHFEQLQDIVKTNKPEELI